MNKLIVISLMFIAIMALPVFGVTMGWDNDTGNQLWSDPCNWYDYFGTGPNDIGPGDFDIANNHVGIAIIDQAEIINSINCGREEPNDPNNPYYTDPNFHAGFKIVSGGSLLSRWGGAFIGWVGYPNPRQFADLIVDGGSFESLNGLLAGPNGRGNIELHAGTITVNPAGPQGIWIGYHMNSHGNLLVTGGILECYTLRVGVAAPLPDPNLPNGAVHGTMTQTGGQIIIHDSFWVSGDIHLDGGLLTVDTNELYLDGYDGSIDITEGKMQFVDLDPNDVTTLVNTGVITGFGGTGTVVVDFNETSLITTITAEGCSDPPAGDTNSDCYVDLYDLADVGGSWLDCTRYPNGCQ